MATQIVPYNTTMQLGTGFNSFTQTLCVNNAVVCDSDVAQQLRGNEKDGDAPRQVAQSVVYKTSIISKTTDVTNEMNFTAAFAIKFDQLKINGGGSYMNTSRIKDSDISIVVSVKQLLEILEIRSYPVGKKAASSWLWSASKPRTETKRRISLPREEKEKDKSDLELKFDKIKKELGAKNEVSVSVTWTGGGQDLKPRGTPMRTHALLTKYTALRSFHESQNFILPAYDNTVVDQVKATSSKSGDADGNDSTKVTPSGSDTDPTIDNIAIKPEIATNKTRQAPYLSPFLFKMLLPLGVPLTPKSSEAQQALDAANI
ncbi:hypothetical protein N0V91_009651 [Didymella pomorum]|uniref:Uncharacterized protein n=1 Tax=Didymella pomorum TaxID=749634 RepID=A0A9W8Z959_9PLEO|nr:hypothetical protein N0V91_009651 [Didymella pomorum]